MASKYSIEAVFKLIDKITAPLDKVAGKGNALGKALKNDFVKTDKSLQKIGETAKKVAGDLVKTAAKATAAFAAAGLAAASAFAVKGLQGAISLERGMAQVGARANMTGEQIKAMSNDLIKVSNATGADLSSLQDAQLQIIESGISAADSVGFLETAVKAAQGGFTDTSTVITGLTSVLKSYGLEAGAASQVSDQMMAAARAGGVSFQDMATKLEHVIPVASKFGVSSDRLLAAVASLTSQGVPIADAAKKIKSALEKDGASGIFNVANGESFNNILADITNSAGATENAFERIDQTTSEKWGSVLNKVKNTGVQLGNSLLPVFNKIIDKISVFADRFAAMDFEPFVKKIESVVDKIFNSLDFDKLADGISTFFGVLMTLIDIVIKAGGFLWDMRGIIIGIAAAWGIYKAAQMAAAVIGPIIGLVKAVQALMGAQKGMNVVQAIFNVLLNANPIGLIVTGIGILIGLFILAYQKIEPFRNAVNGVFAKIKEFGAHLLEKFAPVFEKVRSVIDKVKEVFSNIIGTIGRVISIFTNLFQTTGEVSGGFSLLNGAMDFFSTVAQIAWTIIGGLVETFGNLFSGINDVIDAFTNGGFLAGIKQIGASLLRYLLTPIKAVLDAVSFLPGIGDLAKSAANKIGDFQESLRYNPGDKTESPAPAASRAAPAASRAAPAASRAAPAAGTATLPQVTRPAPGGTITTTGSIPPAAPAVRQPAILNLRTASPVDTAPGPRAASPWMIPTTTTTAVESAIAAPGGVMAASRGTSPASAAIRSTTPGTSPAAPVTRTTQAQQAAIQSVTVPVKWEFPEMIVPAEIIKTIAVPVEWAFSAALPPAQTSRIVPPAGPVSKSVGAGITPPEPPMTQAEQIIYSRTEHYENVRIAVSPESGTSARIVNPPKSPNVELVVSGDA